MQWLGDGWMLSRAGDAALVLECEQRIDPIVNERVLIVAEALRGLARPGVRDVVESYCAVTLHYDPLKTDVAQLITDLGVVVGQTKGRPVGSENSRRLAVPVCYGGDYGPDLAAVAEFSDRTEADVIAVHASESYRVYMLGFLPGFAYMGSVPSTIAMPRRSVPRLDVPAGSVGIAGSQTGVYPVTAPGGWQLVGRTPLAVFDLDRDEPFFFRPGDQVTFEPIGPERFETMRRRCDS